MPKEYEGDYYIPDGISTICGGAFSYCRGLTSITIPKSMINIDNGTFSGCENLKHINVVSDNKVYDSRDNCNAIIKTETNELIAACPATTIPTSVTSIGSLAFDHCIGLTNIEIPSSVTSIGGQAFQGCPDLISLVIPNSVTTIGGWLCWECSNLKSITYPDEVTQIEEQNFSGCRSLSSLVLPEGLKSIGQENGEAWFYGCDRLVSITIPKSVTSIRKGYFRGVPLETIIVKEGNPVFDSREGCNAIIETSSNTLLVGCKKTFIPQSVSSIDSEAFAFCNIETINVMEGNLVYDSRDNCHAVIETATNKLVIGSSKTIIPVSVTSIGANAFYGNKELKEITIPENVSSIGTYAFYETGIKSLVIPKGVYKIEKSAFSGCHDLESIVLSGNVSIDDYAFYASANSNLLVINSYIKSPSKIFTSVFPREAYSKAQLLVPKGTRDVYSSTEGWKLFENIVEKTEELDEGDNIYAETPEGIKMLFQITDAFKKTVSVGSRSYFKAIDAKTKGQVTIPEVIDAGYTVTAIDDNAFKDCSLISSLSMPNTIESIGKSAFDGCI